MTQPRHSWSIDFPDALYAKLSAATANVRGNDGNPAVVHESNPQGQGIAPYAFFGDIRDGEHGISKMRSGRKTRDEAFTQTIWFVGGNNGASKRMAFVDAFAQFACLEDILAEDPSIGLDSTLVAEVGKWMTRATPTPDGWLCFLRVNVHVTSRLV